MLPLSNMCKMRNKHLKQLKGKEGTAKKCLLERRKLNLNQVLLVLQKNKKQNLLYTAQEPQGKTQEGKEGREARCQRRQGEQHQEAKREPGLTWATSTSSSLPTAIPLSANSGTSPIASPWCHLLLLQSLAQATPYTHLPTSLSLLHPKRLINQRLQKNGALVEQNHLALLRRGGIVTPQCRTHQTKSISFMFSSKFWSPKLKHMARSEIQTVRLRSNCSTAYFLLERPAHLAEGHVLNNTFWGCLHPFADFRTADPYFEFLVYRRDQRHALSEWINSFV